MMAPFQYELRKGHSRVMQPAQGGFVSCGSSRMTSRLPSTRIAGPVPLTTTTPFLMTVQFISCACMRAVANPTCLGRRRRASCERKPVRAGFDAEPWRTSRELFERLQAAQPGKMPDGQLLWVTLMVRIWPPK
jgi:hypothetical protein